MPDLNKINQEPRAQGLHTLGLSRVSDPTQIRFLVKQLEREYPVLTGTDQVSEGYGNVAVEPTTFSIDRQGNIVHKIEGARKKEEFEKMIKALLTCPQ